MKKRNLLWVLVVICLACAAFMGGGTALGEEQEPAVGENFTFNFQNADIRSVIKSVAKITGRNFVIDPKVTGNVSIISSDSMDAEELYRVFLSVLQVHGFSAIEAGDVVKITSQILATGDMGADLVDPERRVGHDETITRIHKLQYVPADKLVALLRPLLPKEDYIAAHPDSNLIIISGGAGNVDRLVKMVRKIDMEGGGEFEIVRLENANASDVAAVIDGLEIKGRKMGPDQLRLIADERTNSILLGGDKGHFLRIRSMIAHLDEPIESEGNTQVVYLRFARAKELVAVLTGMNLETTPASTPPAGHTQLRDEIDIRADEATNSLIISAPPSTMKSLLAVVRKLDIRRPQLYIEAVIAEVSTSKAEEFGIQWRSRKEITDISKGFIGGTNFNATGAGINQATVNPFAIGDGLAVAYFDSTTKILGTEIINLGVLVKALAADGDTNILSTPTLVAMDNEEAEIIVGQNVPFITGSYTSTGGTSSSVNPFQTIERHDVGVKLQVKPQISEGDIIRLDIKQEVSNVASSNPQGLLTTNTRSINTSVLVEDGKILVLGGLIEDDLKEGVQKVPLFGDIPLLGHLFRYNQSQRVKQNLMVFLRPVILRNEGSSSQITFDKYDYMRRLQQDFKTNEIVPLMPRAVPSILPEFEEQNSMKQKRLNSWKQHGQEATGQNGQ